MTEAVYRLTVNPERNESQPQWKPVVVEFKDKEEFEKYRAGEYQYCQREYYNYTRAWTKTQREETYAKLVNMRTSYMNNYRKVQSEEPKELA